MQAESPAGRGLISRKRLSGKLLEDTREVHEEEDQMSKINAAWHDAHKMPTKPSAQQRAEWHYGHALNCGCRKVTPSIQTLLETHGYKLPPDAPGLAGATGA